MQELTVLNNLKGELNSTGCGFCLAKWTQVTIHLQMGETHSCHHPKTHKVPLAELTRNPSALHNTRYKKQLRREMLEGKRPEECEYCWNVEDSSDLFSDRIYKSNEPWSKPHLEEIKNLDWRQDFNPRYVEVAFSNTCNFKCSYCGPSFSSTWIKEVEKYGGYPTSDNFNDLDWLDKTGKLPILINEENPYVDAFWEWWPELFKDLHTFRITGGEPLLSKDTWKVLDFIIEHENPNTELKLGINSNLGVPDNLVDKLIEKIKIIEERNLVKELVIYTSCDTAGEQAEYIRHGLQYEKLLSNIEKIFKNTIRTSVVIMSTFNALSLFRYKELMAFTYDIKKKYNSPDRYWNPAIFLDSSYLRYPNHQSVKILPVEFADLVDELADFGDSLRLVNKKEEEEWQPWYMGFTDIEIDKLRRISDWMRDPQGRQNLDVQRINFVKFFDEHDRRRGTNFSETFPELVDFYLTCKDLIEN